LFSSHREHRLPKRLIHLRKFAAYLRHLRLEVVQIAARDGMPTVRRD
jgi:hypothetical protein